jgi:3-deoxy-D-manno-octulosonic-acid transferase
MADTAPAGALLRGYLAATEIAAPLARRHLARRLARGKEDPGRVAEKEGEPSGRRPQGRLIWLHAVGVGEVLALPGLARALTSLSAGISVLVTSSTRTSWEALAPNLPDGVRHQFLPLDVGPWRRRFLDHWQPDLSVWAERDVWPGFVHEAHRRGIPLALVNGRMEEGSFRSKARARRLFADIYRRFSLIEVQDEATAGYFAQLGADRERISVTGSLKTAAPPLADWPEARAAVAAALAGRRTWLAASTHRGDEFAIAAAHRLLLATDPGACLVVAPRVPERAAEAQAALTEAGLDAVLLPPDNLPPRPAQALVVGRIGQLGLWYRLADAAFVGGSFAPVGGHNPWEPARLDCAILHGPNTANFAADYAVLAEAGAARLVRTPEDLAAALTDPETAGMRPRAAALAAAQGALPRDMARRLVALMEGGR